MPLANPLLPIYFCLSCPVCDQRRGEVFREAMAGSNSLQQMAARHGFSGATRADAGVQANMGADGAYNQTLLEDLDYEIVRRCSAVVGGRAWRWGGGGLRWTQDGTPGDAAGGGCIRDDGLSCLSRTCARLLLWVFL